MKKQHLLFIFIFFTINSLYSQWVTKHFSENDYYSISKIVFDEEGHGFAIGAYSSILRSMDEGESWETIYCDGIHPSDIQFLNDSTILLAGQLSDTSFGDDYGEILISNDLGDTWSTLFEYPQATFYALHFFEENNGLFISDETIRAFNESDPYAVKYSQEDSDYSYISVHQLSSPSAQTRYAWVSGRAPEGDYPLFDYFLIKTIDAGQTWSKLDYFFESRIFDMEWLSDTEAYLSTAAGKIFHTTDGGLSWEAPFQLPENIVAFDLAIPSNNAAFFAGGQGLYIPEEATVFTLGSSTDNGTNWSSETQVGFGLGAAYFINDSIGFVGGERGLIMKTTHGGGALSDNYPWEQVATTEVNLNSNLKAFPNPTTGLLTIQSEEDFDFIRIFDVNGRPYLELDLHKDHQPINVSALPPGLYTILVSNKEKQQLVRFVKE